MIGEKMEDTNLENRILGGILGLAVGNALGVPVEFNSRVSLWENPVIGMRGHGTYNQPPGTWSDDTSLTLCLLDSLTKENRFNDADDRDPTRLDYEGIMQRFASWIDEEQYTAHGEVFDVGIATRKALQRFRNGTEPLECGGTSEHDNGNGSLMRILPIVFYLNRVGNWLRGDRAADFQIDRTYIDIVHKVSSLTHAHQRSRIACGLYFSIAYNLLYEKSLKKAVRLGLKNISWRYESNIEDLEYGADLKHYKRLLKTDFAKLPEEEIKSSGYVVDTLEAAIWCLLNTNSYKACVLKAVNLGEDTDTVAAVAGGLAGMFYGVDSIPENWLNQLARQDYIEELCEDFYRSLTQWDGE
jgi:ADP-ribosylglycohydrolase